MHNLATTGATEAIKLARLEHAGIQGVHAFARRHSIECDAVECPTVDIMYDESQLEAAKKAVAKMQGLMPGEKIVDMYKFHEGPGGVAIAEQEYLCAGAKGCISYEAGSISAYKFVCGILRLALQMGLNLQTNTPATALATDEVNADNGKWIVQTERGIIKAKKIVLATNGYTAALYKKLQGVIVPLRGQVTAQRPGSGMPTPSLKTTYSLHYDDGHEYMIPQQTGTRFEGDIIMGGGLRKVAEGGLSQYGETDDSTRDEIISNHLHNCTQDIWGKNWGEDHMDGRIRAEWSGVMGFSADGFPMVGEIPDEKGLYICASFQGHGTRYFFERKTLFKKLIRRLGMALVWRSAEAATKIMLEEDDADLSDWFPKPYRISKERMQLRFRGIGNPSYR